MTTLWRLYMYACFTHQMASASSPSGDGNLNSLLLEMDKKKSFSLFNDLATSSKSRSVTRTRNARTTKLVKCVKDGDKNFLTLWNVLRSIRANQATTCQQLSVTAHVYWFSLLQKRTGSQLRRKLFYTGQITHRTWSSLHLHGKRRHDSAFHNILHALGRTGSKWIVVHPGSR